MTPLEELAELEDDAIRSHLAHMSVGAKRAILHEWKYIARPEQLTPSGDWNIWIYLAGRGAGKTRSMAEDFKPYGLAHPGSRLAIIAPTYADARDTCIEGDSGLLGILDPKDIRTWNRSLGELILVNGTRYKLFSAEEPERLRGPQHHRVWAAELCAWGKNAVKTWDNMSFGLRLGDDPRVVCDTTPKPIRLLIDLLKREGKGVHVTRGNTFDNALNLAKTALEELKRRYLGTRVGRQELFAEVLADNPGALWKRDSMIEAYRVTEHPELKRIVVAVDPAVKTFEDAKEQLKAQSENEETGAEIGIIVAGLGIDNQGYVLADYSMHGSPLEWATAVVAAYSVFKADRVVAEINQGGALVESNIRTVKKNIAYEGVSAMRGKQLRAEPVASLYEQGRVHHVGAFPELEDQLCTWEPGMKSPDRLDALVWAFTELMVEEKISGGILLPTTETVPVARSSWEEQAGSMDWY